MKPRIHLLHGIHTSEKNATVAQLMPYLHHGTGLEVEYHRYGYAHALTSRWLNPGRAQKLAEHIAPGDLCVGHSNGCCLIWMMAAHCGAPIGGAAFVNPALDVAAEFPASMRFVHVYHNAGDAAVPWTKYLLGAHPWGPMGRDGYRGSDARVENIDCQDEVHPVRVDGHSAFFVPETLAYWGEELAQRIAEALGLAPVCRAMEATA